MLKGVDISKYQGVVDFNRLKAAVDFVIIRSSANKSYVDTQFARNRDEARRVGLLVGFYHYCYPEYNGPEVEAQHFYNTVGTPREGEILVLDYESAWSGDPVAWSKKFLDKLSSLYGGYKPMIYLNLATVKAHDWSPVINGNYGLWLAKWDYNSTAAAPATPWPTVAMRQYSNKENIAGLNPVDGDVFYGDRNTYIRYGYKGGSPMPTNPFDATVPGSAVKEIYTKARGKEPQPSDADYAAATSDRELGFVLPMFEETYNRGKNDGAKSRQPEVDSLNAQVNKLKTDLAACQANPGTGTQTEEISVNQLLDKVKVKIVKE